jgi:hypothetical protein
MERPLFSATTFFDLIRTRRTFEELPRARKLQLAAMATLGALVFAALWGAAAGSCVATLALGNLIKVPIVVLLSAVAAAPLGVVAWKLLGEETSATDLLLAHARSLLCGSLLLGTLVPIVALYYHSSAFAGPLLADGTALLSLLLGGAVFLRLAWRAPGAKNKVVGAVVPGVVLAVQAAAMLQLVALASPILPDPTMFRHGVDGFVTSTAEPQ